MTPEEEAQDENSPQERLQELAPQNITLARQDKNNAADPELLTHLGRLGDQEIRKAIASNPNTPTELLIKLGETYPRELLDNPVFDLLLLENPNFFVEMPLATLLSLLTFEDFAKTWGRHLLNHREEDQILRPILCRNVSAWNEWRKSRKSEET